MELKNLVKLNLKSLQELKEKSSGADLETINKVMETVREKYRKKNGATKGKSGGSSNSSTSGSSKNEESQVWTAPSETECRKTTTLNEAINKMKNYKPRQKLVPKAKKRPDPIEKEVPDMISMYLQDEKKIVNKVLETSTVNPDTRFDFLKNYDILSITFQVIHK